jgi:hypothetical protein
MSMIEEWVIAPLTFAAFCAIIFWMCWELWESRR